MKSKARKLLVAVLGVAAIVYLLVAGPGTGDVDIQEELYSRYRLLVKYRSTAEQFSEMGETSADLDTELAGYERRFLTGDSPSLASAELQRKVSDLAQGAGLMLQTVKPMPFIETGDFVQIPLLFEFRGRMMALQDLVRRLEKDRLGLHVSKLSISVVNVRDPSELNVKIAVHGIMRL